MIGLELLDSEMANITARANLGGRIDILPD